MAAPKGHKPYKGAETGGRPGRYSSQDIERFADELLLWLNNPLNVWFKDFCLEKDINPDLMAEWANDSEKFGGAYKLAKHRQESRLINGGLMNTYNGSIVKFVLGNAHGWVDKQETKISGDAVNPLAFILKNVDGTTKELVNDKQE